MSEQLTAEAIIQRIATYADDVAAQAGVGAMETADSMVSFLAANPQHIDDFVHGRAGALDWPLDWIEQGNLSWHGQNGAIVSPADVRARRAAAAAIRTDASIA